MTKLEMQTVAQVVSTAVVQALMSLNAPTQKPKASKPVAKSSKPQPKAELTDNQQLFRAAVVATFKAKGLKVVPNVDVLTFGKWEKLGFRPKAGETATFVKTKGMNGNGIALFHKEQVEKVA